MERRARLDAYGVLKYAKHSKAILRYWCREKYTSDNDAEFTNFTELGISKS